MKHIIMLTLFCLSITSFSEEPRVYQFVGAEFPNILTSNKDGTFSGSAVDIIKYASKKLKFKYEISIYPWVRATQMVMQGKADALIGPYKTIEREKAMTFTVNHFYEDQIIIITRKDSPMKWSGDIIELKDRKIGVVRGWALGKAYEKYSLNLEVTHVDSTQKLLQMLKLQRVDTIIVHRRGFMEDVKEESISLAKFKILSPPLSKQKGYFAFSTKENLDSFIRDFNKLINNQTK